MISPKPLIVIACQTAHGHTFPLLPHATHLRKQGYHVSFIASPEFAGAIQKTGAEFYPTENTFTRDLFKEMATVPEGLARRVWATKRAFIDTTAIRMETLRKVLEQIREAHPHREVIILQERMFMGTWPFRLGAPLPKGYDRFPKVICFLTSPIAISSIDTAPFGYGLPPDTSAEGRARYAAMYKANEGMQRELIDYANAVYQRLGATVKVTEPVLDLWSVGHDATAMPCSPSLEYPRSDLSPKIRFIGGTPCKELDPSIIFPTWWAEIKANQLAAFPKKVVFVSQGTIALDYSSLLVPTMQALAGRDDILVVAVLGVKNATLGEQDIPSNARITDYLAYNAILPYTDVFVTNAGYGGFMQGVMHGVPMVLAGTGRKFVPKFSSLEAVCWIAHHITFAEDKPEVCMRGEWAGIAVNLRTDQPSLDAIRKGVNEVLSDGKYKARCSKIQRENEELDCVTQLEKLVVEVSNRESE